MLDEIIEIIELDEELTIDIEVSGNHLFFANDILVHNSSWDADKISQAHIQGGISKVQTCDLMVSIVQNEAMKTAGEYLFEFTKTRNSGAVGDSILLKWEAQSLRVSNFEAANKGLEIKKKDAINNTVLDTKLLSSKSSEKTAGKGRNLLELMGNK